MFLVTSGRIDGWEAEGEKGWGEGEEHERDGVWRRAILC